MGREQPLEGRTARRPVLEAPLGKDRHLEAGHCLDAARALDLLWTGIDLRLTPEGRYVFLEANPSPMFLGFESRSGLPLTDALADLLTEVP